MKTFLKILGWILYITVAAIGAVILGLIVVANAEWVVAGLAVGFFLTYLFDTVEEFKKKKTNKKEQKTE